MPKEDPQAVADRNKARRQAELDQAATLQDDAAILTDEMRKIYGFRNLGRRGATAAAIAAATAAAAPAAAAPSRETAMDRQQQQFAMGGGGSPLAPLTSPRPMPNPNYGTSARAAPLAPATSIRPQPNPFFSLSDQKQGQQGYSLAPATSPRPQPNPNFSKSSSGRKK